MKLPSYQPIEHAHFHALVSDARDGIEIAAGYGDLLTCGDPTTELHAARTWCAWEAAVVSVDPRAEANSSYDDERFCLGFARIVTHYFRNLAWLKVPLVEQAEQLSEIETVMIHSRLDLSAPLLTPWQLHQAMRRSELIVLPGGLHGTVYGPLSDAIVAAGNRMSDIR